MWDDLLRAAQTVVRLPDDVVAPAAHQTEPVVLPVLLDTGPLQPGGPLTLAQVILHVPPPPVKALRAKHLDRRSVKIFLLFRQKVSEYFNNNKTFSA